MEQDWINDLPESYRDPAKIKDALARLETLEPEAAQYKDFYEKQYMPWVKDHGTAFQQYQQEAEAFRQWKNGQQHASPDPVLPSTVPASLNFDDPDVNEKIYSTLHDEIGSLKSEIGGLKSSYEAERNNVYQLIALQEQAYGLMNSELYDHLSFKPKTNIRDVAKYARDHGLADLTEAAQQLYRTDREKALEAAAYERAKRDLEQQRLNEQVTTEMGTGTPFPELRRNRPEGLGRGYGNTNLEAMQRAIAERRAGRRMATS